jgi:hypothetical protein
MPHPKRRMPQVVTASHDLMTREDNPPSSETRSNSHTPARKDPMNIKTELEVSQNVLDHRYFYLFPSLTFKNISIHKTNT